MAVAEKSSDRLLNPLDLIEHLAQGHDWPHERASDEELTLIVAGTWADYHISINWRDDLEALHLACAFDFRVPDNRLTEMYRLVAQINEQLWLGHFDLWTQEGLVMFRHALLLNGAVATVRQCEAMLKAALEGCERYYQAFQFVVWAGKESREALVSTMFETQGQA
jgi:hypothetical protein